MNNRIVDWIYNQLGTDAWGDGSSSPPSKNYEVNFGEIEEGKPIHVAMILNDGSELWLGTPNNWHCFYRAKQSRQLAWFILWTWWIKGTWFGLRRWLWYWALRKRCDKMGIKAF